MRIESGTPKAREYERLVREVAGVMGIQVDFPRARWSVLALTRTLERLRERGAPLSQAPDEWGRVLSERDWDSVMSLKDLRLLTRQDVRDAEAEARRVREECEARSEEAREAVRLAQEAVEQQRRRNDEAMKEAEANVLECKRRVSAIESYVARSLNE